MPLDFKVLDFNDKQLLPGSKVTATAQMSGKTYSFSAITDAAGRVSFSGLPKCGSINVYAEAEGYKPDSITGKTTESLVGDIDSKRLLQLKQIRKPIVFYVVDCKTGSGLAGADVTIELDKNGSITKLPPVKTNIEGVGKGVYDSAFVLAKVHLSGRKAYYKPGSLPGWHKVNEFIDSTLYNKQKRTFCLEPEPNPFQFINVDSITGKPIAGVKNTITFTHNDGKTETEIVTSDRNGIVPVSLNPGDKITIVASYPPGYKDNDFTIKNEEVDKLRQAPVKPIPIPLAPVIVELVFRTVEADNSSVLVPAATLEITGTGLIPTVPVESGTGEFVVKATLMSTISITASKTDYITNDFTIRNANVQTLQTATQDKRDIPLKHNPPPPKACIEPPLSAGNNEESTEEYDMGTTDRKFQIRYSMYEQPDRIVVYCGTKNNKGAILYDGGADDKSVNKYVDIDMSECKGSTFITVVITPLPEMLHNSNYTDKWDYKIICPK